MDKNEARERLLNLCKPGTIVYTVLRHCSRSGMTRWIDCYVIEDGEPVWISGLIGLATDLTFDRRRESIKIGGCGMDMGFALVNHLSYALHGFESKGKGADEAQQGRPMWQEDINPDNYRAGYSLTHRWL